jgi:tetratricopeptide (TPR) repeat protein
MSRSDGSTSASSEDRVTPELGHPENNLRILNEIRDKRKALLSCPVGYSDRAERASELVDALFILYGRIGGQALIDEAIKVHREFIASRLYERDFFNRPIAPSYRPVRYKEPAGARYDSLDQAIKLGYDRLSSHPHGHPARASSCASLGNALLARYNQVGDAALLNEAIELHREALSLRPDGHPDRASSCAHLAASLRQRYKLAGDESLDEALELEHEALALRPQIHPNRASSCASLAVSIYERYNQTGHITLLNKAIELNREALALRPPGHADRPASCGDLGALLHMRYTQTGERSLLNEAIELGREALTLRPPGHPKRSLSCKNLAHALFASYNRTGSIAVLDEAIDMCSYVVENGSTSEVSHSLTLLSQAHLFPGPHHSLWKASHYLHRSVLNEVDNLHGFLHSLTYILSLLWNISPAWTPCVTSLLCRVYAMIIDRLPLAASFALDASAQLQTLKSTRQIGTDACVAAVLATQHSMALELLDRGHGVVWTQALHQRDPQMEHVPPDLAFELEALLRAIAVPTPAKFAESPHHHRDIRHRQNTRIQAILREIRAKPNMKRFMLGSTYDTLRKAAHNHPVVTLVAARGHAFALIMKNDAEDEPHVLRLDLTLDALRLLRDSSEQAGLRSRAREARECDLDARLGLQKREINVNHKPLRVLADIWHKVVKPVIDHLQLKVTSISRETRARLTCRDRRTLVDRGPGSTGAPTETLSSFLCMQQVSTRVLPTIKSAVRTMSFRRTLRRSRLCSAPKPKPHRSFNPLTSTCFL